MSFLISTGTVIGDEEDDGEEDGELSCLGGLKCLCLMSMVASSFHSDPSSELFEDGRRRCGEGEEDEELRQWFGDVREAGRGAALSGKLRVILAFFDPSAMSSILSSIAASPRPPCLLLFISKSSASPRSFSSSSHLVVWQIPLFLFELQFVTD